MTASPYREVSITGRVRAPGTYPLEADMRVSDLIRAGGNLTEDAYTLKAELVRYAIVDGEYRNTEVVEVDLAKVLREDPDGDVVLAEHDNLRVSGLPAWDSLWSVTLDGEVRFPRRVPHPPRRDLGAGVGALRAVSPTRRLPRVRSSCANHCGKESKSK